MYTRSLHWEAINIKRGWGLMMMMIMRIYAGE
jgi:hypothetical protein